MMKALFLSWFIAGPALAAEVDSTSRTCSELVAEWYAKRISYEFKIPKDTSIAVVVSKPMDEAIIKFMNNHSILKKASSLSKHDRWSAYAKLSSEDIQSLANIMNEYDPDVLNSCQRLHSKIELKCPHQETTNVQLTANYQRCVDTFSADLMNWETRYNRQTARMIAQDELKLIEDLAYAASPSSQVSAEPAGK